MPNLAPHSHYFTAPKRDSDFSRQNQVAGMDADAQQRLRSARVLVFGAGGLAATALPYLAAAGIGQLTIVDFDTIELSNLHRQLLFTYDDIGRHKAIVAAEYCVARAVDCTITAITTKLTIEQIYQQMCAHDIVVDCSDDSQLAYQLNDCALVTQTPVVFANAAVLQGQLFTLLPNADQACWRCIWPADIQGSGNCQTLGVLGPVPGILGAMQALEVLKWASASLALNQQTLAYVDLRQASINQMRVHKDSECNHQLNFKQLNRQYMNIYYQGSIADAQSQGYKIIDIRSDMECAMRRMPFADVEIGMNQLAHNPAHYLQPDEAVLLVCATGPRAIQLATYLHSLDYNNVLAYTAPW